VARIYIERQELPEDIRQLFDAMCDGAGVPHLAAAAECSPALDVVETETGIEVFVDLPGVAASAIQVVFARNVLLVAGHKPLPACDHGEAAFHLAERSFGRFARVIRLEGAFEGARASASLSAGELRVAVPRIDDRRGREIRIPVRA
jgi:HSP20 family protein